MSLLFVFLKAAHIWETPWDWPICMVLVDLDLIAYCQLRRLYLYARGR